MYWLGVAFSDDLINWWEHPRNPLLIPNSARREHPFSGRLEGGVFFKEDILNTKSDLRLMFMTIPCGVPSSSGCVVAIANGKRHARAKPYLNLKATIEIENHNPILKNSNGSFTLCAAPNGASLVHLPLTREKPQNYKMFHSLRFSIASISDELNAEIILGVDIAEHFSKGGLKITIKNGKLYLPTKSATPEWLSFSEKEPLNIQFTSGPKNWIISVQGKEVGKWPTRRVERSGPARILSFLLHQGSFDLLSVEKSRVEDKSLFQLVFQREASQ